MRFEITALILALASCQVIASSTELTYVHKIKGLIPSLSSTPDGEGSSSGDEEVTPPGETLEPEVVQGGSCKSILDSGGSIGDGVYTITPVEGNTFDVYCDMTTEGGGWALVAAQFETTGTLRRQWDEGRKSDYDPSLSSGEGFVLGAQDIPYHTQTSFGFGAQAVIFDYFNYQYTTGNIETTMLTGLLTGSEYQIARHKDYYYPAMDPEYGTQTTSYAQWKNSLTVDLYGKKGARTWAFAPGSTSGGAGYSMMGANSSTIEVQPWTVWVR